MENKELITRIRKGVIFLRSTSVLSESEMYHKAVIKFLGLVDELVGREETEKTKAEQAGLI